MPGILDNPVAANPVLQIDPTAATAGILGRGSVGPVFDRTTVGSGRPVGDDYSVLDVNPRALIAAHGATDPGMAQYDKTGRIWDFVNKGNTLSMPEVGAAHGRLGFTNGRNRAKVAADAGLPSIPIAVDRGNEADVLNIIKQFAQ